MITAKQLVTIFPAMLAQFRKGFDVPVWVAAINKAMALYDINTPEREAAFLAQVGHESGQLRYLKEIWGPTAQQLKYEGRADLGNDSPGDGKKFMGRGPIQITGKKNYIIYGKALGLDLLNHPELLEIPENGMNAAALFFKNHGCNELADDGAFGRITKVINGGLNGYADRCEFYAVSKKVLGVDK